MVEILPLVEFELEEGISDEEAEKLIEEPIQNSEELNLVEDQLTITTKTDLFTDRLVRYEVCELSVFSVFSKIIKIHFFQNKLGGSTVLVNRGILKSMEPSSVLIVKWPKPFKTRYFKNLLTDLQVTSCKTCLKVFYLKITLKYIEKKSLLMTKFEF